MVQRPPAASDYKCLGVRTFSSKARGRDYEYLYLTWSLK